MPELGLLVKPLMDKPGKATAFFTPGCFKRDVGHFANDVFGAVERGAVGQLGEGDEIAFVLRRHETHGDPREAEYRYANQAERRSTRAIALERSVWVTSFP